MNSGIAMGATNVESRFLTKEEEERLAEGLRRTLISYNPNPNRDGCPDPKVIRDLAFHKRIGDPEFFERVTNHMAECSACVRDALSYAEEYKENKKRRRAVSMAFALVAVVVLSVALWAIWRMQQQQPIIAKSPDVPTQSSPPPVVADAGNVKQSELPQFQPVMIELPLSWRGGAPTERPLIIPRGHLQLEIRLPIGSSEGTYKLRISDSSGKVQLTVEGTTQSANGITRLIATLDTSALSPGSYTLGVLEPGFDEWSDYPLAIK